MHSIYNSMRPYDQHHHHHSKQTSICVPPVVPSTGTSRFCTTNLVMGEFPSKVGVHETNTAFGCRVDFTALRGERGFGDCWNFIASWRQ